MCASNPKIFESIKLQRDFQLKTMELVRLRKSQYEKYKAAIEQQRQKSSTFLEQRIVKDRIGNVCDLQISIFKALEESDTLLDSLGGKRLSARTSPDTQRTVLADGAEPLSENTSANKPKTSTPDDSVLDEMHTLNNQLHILVFNLVNRIEESAHEMDVLRDRIKVLEKNERQCQRKSSSAINTNKSLSESSSKTDESPTSYSDHENQRNSLSGEERKIVLPDTSDLPPLELPEFDYNF